MFYQNLNLFLLVVFITSKIMRVYNIIYNSKRLKTGLEGEEEDL